MDNYFKTQSTRTKIIDACIEQGKTIEEANVKLQACNFTPITNQQEMELYENMRQNYLNSSLRKKLIEKGKLDGLSRYEVNLILSENSLRPLNEYEADDYEYNLGRKGNIDLNSLGKRTWEDEKLTREDIIQNGIKKRSSTAEINIQLIQNGYDEISDNGLEEFKKNLSSSAEVRERMILNGIKQNVKATELNKRLKNQNLPPLSQFEIVDYDQKKHNYHNDRRKDLIQYCIEQKKYIDEINELLRKHEFDRISEAEEKQILEMYENNTDSNRTNSLSAAFQTLYKEAIKQFHPDMFSNIHDKKIATERMKEINEAKSLRDYLKLKDLIERYKIEDELDNKRI